MTQALPRLADPGVAEAAQPTSDSALVRLIEAELSPLYLSRTLDAPANSAQARHWQTSLAEPLLELLGRGGKYFRCRLVEVAYQLSHRPGRPAMPEELPLVVEVLHAGSLIIDDIEDDSESRRGKPALHRLVGVSLALNAGNWLYFLPHRLLEELRLDGTVELELRRAIDRAVLRCHYGQALDLGVRLSTLARTEVFDLVSLATRLKTGSLLELAAELGAIAGGAPPALRGALQRFARSYGVALQMLDDASGLYQPGRAHKAHEDLCGGRLTWPWAWLSRRLDELSYSRLQHQAQAVERRELQPEVLAAALRQKLGASPQRAVHDGLVSAFRELASQVSDDRLLEPLAEEIARLESAYV
jgi:geranylgeranyl pyrophosphate synthase